MNEMYNRIESLCKESGINITQMCRKADIPRGNLTDLKNGRTAALSTKNLGKISAYFGVSLDYLLGNVSDPFFYLDNERILRDINSYEGEENTVPTQEGEHEEDPDIRRIERARQKMSNADKKKMKNILKASFEDYFSDDYEDTDVDE